MATRHLSGNGNDLKRTYKCLLVDEQSRNA